MSERIDFFKGFNLGTKWFFFYIQMNAVQISVINGYKQKTIVAKAKRWFNDIEMKRF